VKELAEAIVADKGSPPVLLLAAWHYLHGWKRDWLPSLVEQARLEEPNWCKRP
jgi:hypothetical protein